MIDKDNTTIVDGKGKDDDIKGRIAEIKVAIDKSTSDYDREKLQERLAKLSGGVAVINVGAATETEMKEKKARVEDALHATRAAVEEGIVPGGGVALIRAQAALEKIRGTDDEKIGVEIVRRALEEPIRMIAQNAGAEGSIVVARVKESKDKNFGYNAATDVVRGPGQGRRHRPDQGHPDGAAERGVDRGPAPHHRVRGGREEGRQAGSGGASGRRHGRDVLATAAPATERPGITPGAFLVGPPAPNSRFEPALERHGGSPARRIGVSPVRMFEAGARLTGCRYSIRTQPNVLSQQEERMFRRATVFALCAFTLGLVAARPAVAQRVSLSPTIGVYIPTTELIKAANGEEFKQEAAVSVGGRLGVTLSPRFGIETTVSYVPSSLRFTFDGNQSTTDANLLFGSARASFHAIPMTQPVWLTLNGGVSMIKRSGAGVREPRGRHRRGWRGRRDGRLPPGEHVQLLRGRRGLRLRPLIDETALDAESKTQNDVQIALGFGFPIGR